MISFIFLFFPETGKKKDFTRFNTGEKNTSEYLSLFFFSLWGKGIFFTRFHKWNQVSTYKIKSVFFFSSSWQRNNNSFCPCLVPSGKKCSTEKFTDENLFLSVMKNRFPSAQQMEERKGFLKIS